MKCNGEWIPVSRIFSESSPDAAETAGVKNTASSKTKDKVIRFTLF
jgi:hypothetical protein